MNDLESHLEAWLRISADPDGPAEVDPDKRAKWVQNWQSPALSVHWPGAAEQAIRLAALDRDQLIAVAAEALAAGTHDRPVREAPWALAGITPDEVIVAAVRLLAPLDWAELVQRAGPCLAGLYEAQVGWIAPGADPRDAMHEDCPAEDGLAALATASGWRMLAGVPVPDGVPLLDLAAEVGEVVLRCHHANLVRGREVVLEYWRQGDWDELLRIGEIDREGYDDLRIRYPAGNPKYPNPSMAATEPSRRQTMDCVADVESRSQRPPEGWVVIEGVEYPTRETWLAEQQRLACRAMDRARSEGLEALARLGTDEVLERAARRLADGGDDEELRVAGETWAEFQPGKVVERAVEMLTPLGFRELLDRGAAAIRTCYQNLAAYSDPYIQQEVHRWQYLVYRGSDRLHLFQVALGRRALARVPAVREHAAAGAPCPVYAVWELDREVGEAILRGYHAELIRQRDEVVRLVTYGRWDELYSRGEMSKDDFESYSREFPIEGSGPPPISDPGYEPPL